MSFFQYGSLLTKENPSIPITAPSLQSGSLNTDPIQINRQWTAEQTAYLSNFERKQSRSTAALPTDPDQIIQWLRRLGEPKTLFAEGPYQRRERLRLLLLEDQTGIAESLLTNSTFDSREMNRGTESSDAPLDSEEFYVPASNDLISLRKWLISFTFANSILRLESELKIKEKPASAILADRMSAYKTGSSYSLNRSHFAVNGRPYSAICYFNTIDFALKQAALETTLNGAFNHPNSKNPLMDNSIKCDSFKNDSNPSTVPMAKNPFILDGSGIENVSTIKASDSHTQKDPNHKENRLMGPKNINIFNSNTTDDHVFVCGDISGQISWISTCDGRVLATSDPQKGHSSRISGVASSPSPTCLTASCDGVGRIALWKNPFSTSSSGSSSENDSFNSIQNYILPASNNSNLHCANGISAELSYQVPVAWMDGHSARVSRIAFHPSSKLLGSTSFDGSWRLWDLSQEKCSEVQLQEGHSGASYAISFHPDGALVATGGLDGVLRIWDLRSGTAIWSQGIADSHSPINAGLSKGILDLDFGSITSDPLIAAGSEDGHVRVWDLRHQRQLASIPAHSSAVTGVKFLPEKPLLCSTGFDGAVRLWGGVDWRPLTSETLQTGHDGRVTGLAISKVTFRDGNEYPTIASIGADRTLKIWSPASL